MNDRSLDIAGRTVVVTGAGSGIGRAIAFGFLRDGARVVACDIREPGLAALAEEGAITKQTDVSSPEAVKALIERAHGETGRLDALFNNAGFGSRKNVAELGEGEFERMIAVHLFGTIYGMRHAPAIRPTAPRRRPSGRRPARRRASAPRATSS